MSKLSQNKRCDDPTYPAICVSLTCSLNYFVSRYSICWLLYNSIRQLILQWYIALYKPLHSMFHNSDTSHCTNHCNDISGCTAIASTTLKLCYMLCCANQCIHYTITGIYCEAQILITIWHIKQCNSITVIY